MVSLILQISHLLVVVELLEETLNVALLQIVWS